MLTKKFSIFEKKIKLLDFSTYKSNLQQRDISTNKYDKFYFRNRIYNIIIKKNSILKVF